MSDKSNHPMHKPTEKQSQNFKSPRHAEIHGRFETIYDINDALAAAFFIVGSALFFSDETQTAGTWLFLIGSILFFVRPLIHVIRDLKLADIPAPNKDEPYRQGEDESGQQNRAGAS